LLPPSPWSSLPPPPRPFFLLLKSLKGLIRPVTKARRLRWLRARRLARGILSPRIKARARRPKPC